MPPPDGAKDIMKTSESGFRDAIAKDTGSLLVGSAMGADRGTSPDIGIGETRIRVATLLKESGYLTAKRSVDLALPAIAVPSLMGSI